MRQPEGQPQLRLIKPFKKVADSIARRGNQESTPPWIVDNPWLLTDPLLTKSDRELLKTYNPFEDPLLIQERERRAKEPKLSNYFVEDGKMVSMLESFTNYLDLRERLKREAIARGDTEIDESRLPWRPLPEKPTIPKTPEERRARDIPTVYKLHSTMAKEAHDAQFDGIAEVIQEKVWNHKPFQSPSLAIKPAEELKIVIKKDGTLMNRSRFGATISYNRPDIETSVRNEQGGRAPQTEELSFGIGYFGDRATIIPEARHLVTDDELETGVKAYFVKRSYIVRENGHMVRKTETYAIPFGYPKTQETFFDHLYRSAVFISPEKVIPEAKQRKRASRRNKDLAAAA